MLEHQQYDGIFAQGFEPVEELRFERRIRVGDRTISVDLSVDSIASIVAKIRAAGGQAEVQSETVGGVPSYRMSVGGNVTATADPASADTIAALGFSAGAQTSVQQVVTSGLAFQDASKTAKDEVPKLETK